MGVCTLVASGVNFDVDEYLRESPFEVLNVFHRGEAVPPLENPKARPLSDSGFVAVVSHDELLHLLDQAAEALDFLETHEEELRRLKGFGVDAMVLDFRIPQGMSTHPTHFLPPELIEAMGRLKMGLLFSLVDIMRN